MNLDNPHAKQYRHLQSGNSALLAFWNWIQTHERINTRKVKNNAGFKTTTQNKTQRKTAQMTVLSY